MSELDILCKVLESIGYHFHEEKCGWNSPTNILIYKTEAQRDHSISECIVWFVRESDTIIHFTIKAENMNFTLEDFKEVYKDNFREEKLNSLL